MVAFLARTDRFVVSDIAGSVGTAVAWVSALSVDAGIFIATLVVRCTATDDCYLNWSANTIDVSGPAFWTSAGHGPHWKRIKNIASCVLQTWFNNRAWIDAFVLDAHQFVGALDVDSAFWLVKWCRWTMLAVGIGISSRDVLGTATSSQVILNVADSILSTR